VRSDEKSLILVGSTDSALFRWELLFTLANATQFSLVNTVSCQLTSSLSRLCIDNHGERTACINNKTTTIRNDGLKRIRAFTAPTSKDNDSSNELSAVTFAGWDQSVAIVAYENGLIEVRNYHHCKFLFHIRCCLSGLGYCQQRTGVPLQLRQWEGDEQQRCSNRQSCLSAGRGRVRSRSEKL
jgi:hypothetical protein